MSDPLFVLHLGGSTYVDVRGAVRWDPPPGAVVLPKPTDLRLDAAAVAAALRDLADPEVGADEFAERWVQAGQNDQFAEWMFKSAEVATIIGGVLLSVSQPAGLVAAVILGVIVSAFAADDGLDEEVAAELQRLRWQLKAQAEIQEADVLLGMRAEVQGRLEALRSAFGDVVTHKPTGAARIAAFENMKAIVESVSAPIVRIRDEDWIAAYDPESNHARFGLSPILRRVRPNGTLEPIAPQPDGTTRFDYRLGIPMLLYVAMTYPAMLRMAAPIYRSTGSYRDQLRSLAASIDRFVVRMQDECLSRTEHTGQSLFAHDVYPGMLYFGSPLSLSSQGSGAGGWMGPSGPDSYPVGAFDLVRYTDDFIWSCWSKALASGGDRGLVGTFDYTWEPPAALVDAVGQLHQYDEAAVAANERANHDYARLLVVSGAIHMLIASAMLRYLSAPPLTSETIHGSAFASRTLVSESATEARSAVIFPNIQITAPATLKKYQARNTVRTSTQEPGHQPALRYRVVLRTIDSLFGRDAWRDREYVNWVWSPSLEPLPGDPQNLRLRTEFVGSLVLGEVVLYEGVSPTEPVSLSSGVPVTLQAHTYDWYVPVAPSPWVQEVTAITTDRDVLVGGRKGARTPGARSIHLRESVEPLAAARLAQQPMQTLSYHARTKDALTSVIDELPESASLVALLEPSLELAERRHVRAENVTFDWQLHWQDGQLEVRLTGRPENRSCQVFVVIEEAVQSGEAFTEAEWLHTPFAAELVNQLTLVPRSFFDDERRALEAGKRLWDDILRRFAESATVGPEDPVASAVVRAKGLLRESTSTATLSEALDLQFEALRIHEPDLWESVLGSTQPSGITEGQRSPR